MHYYANGFNYKFIQGKDGWCSNMPSSILIL